MWKIWKYPFSISDFELELPAIYEILKVDMQEKKPCMWILVEPTAVKIKRKFRIFGTGHTVPGGPLWSDRSHTSIAIQQPDGSYIRYIDTFFQPPFVWHLFEVVERAIGLDNWDSDVES